LSHLDEHATHPVHQRALHQLKQHSAALGGVAILRADPARVCRLLEELRKDEKVTRERFAKWRQEAQLHKACKRLLEGYRLPFAQALPFVPRHNLNGDVLQQFGLGDLCRCLAYAEAQTSTAASRAYALALPISLASFQGRLRI
jgi:hypothetical protein